MVRKAPTDSATKHPVGKKMRGNDGNFWVIINTSNGVHRWAKSKSSPQISRKRRRRRRSMGSRKRRKSKSHHEEYVEKTEKKEPRKGKRYFTHDNGGRPYMVIVDNKNVYIYRYSDDFPHLEDLKANDYTFLVKEYLGVKEIFIGKAVKGDDSRPSKMGSSKTIGNSILLEISNGRYVFIGGLIYEFEPKDKILEYYSMIGNSDVPYPVAIGEKNVYFVVSGGREGYLSRDYFEGFPSKYSWGLDSYNRLWGTGKFKPDVGKAKKTKKRVGRLSSKHSLENDTHPLPKLKVIDARIN
jgi:hypothetical protein